MAVQTTYSDEYAIAFPGMVADTGLAVIASRTVIDAALDFGKAVAQDSSDDHSVHPFTSGDTAIFGIAVRSQSAPIGGGVDKYAIADTAAIIRKGVVWVTASVAVNAGDPVYVIPATGAFAKTSASSAVLIAGARWEDTVSAPGLARVFLG